jgi:hypothetical protein
MTQEREDYADDDLPPPWWRPMAEQLKENASSIWSVVLWMIAIIGTTAGLAMMWLGRRQER